MKKLIQFTFIATLLFYPASVLHAQANQMPSYIWLQSNKKPLSEKEKGGILKTEEGDTIEILNDVYFYYQKKVMNTKTLDGKSKSFKVKNIARMKLGDRVFLPVSEDKKDKGGKLMELLAQNDKYKLFQFFNDWYNYYVFDHDMNLVEKPIKVTTRGVTIGSEKNNRKAIETLTKYFSNCKSLMDAFQNNFDSKKMLSEDIANISCEGAPDYNVLLK